MLQSPEAIGFFDNGLHRGEVAWLIPLILTFSRKGRRDRTLVRARSGLFTEIQMSKARQLRKNQTDAERFLWRGLRSRQLAGYKFRRQEPIGPFIVDFVCYEKRLVIELDGGQHAEPNQVAYDTERTAWLVQNG